ncbi:MAG: hypothetical protein MI924_07420 [Chloroflexales bacterium]|nr:hypothetical protein [Chloroflexales bacterium]
MSFVTGGSGTPPVTKAGYWSGGIEQLLHKPYRLNLGNDKTLVYMFNLQSDVLGCCHSTGFAISFTLIIAQVFFFGNCFDNLSARGYDEGGYSANQAH